MKKFIIDTNEKNEILKMHGFLKEQVEQQPVNTDEDKLKKAISQGCIAKYSWFTPDQTKPIQKTKSGKPVIVGKGSNGNVYYFYADMNVVNANTGTKKVWECEFKEEPKKPEEPKKLDVNQLKVLELIKPLGWFNEPKPTDVEVDQGLYQAMDLSDPNTDLGRTYSKYFPKEKFKTFVVYRKQAARPQEPGRAEKIEVTAESCKTAIESLYNHMESPNTYPLQNETINSYVKTAQMCAEPANKKVFLVRFGLNKKLDRIARKYGIQN